MSSPKKPQIYEESTQYQHWRFSPEQLWDIRNKRTTEAIERVKKTRGKELVYKINLAFYIQLNGFLKRKQIQLR